MPVKTKLIEFGPIYVYVHLKNSSWRSSLL